MRAVQPEGTRGSLMWLQRAIETRRDLLLPPRVSEIEWRSPLRSDEFAEYRDAAFLKRLELDHLADALETFWPRRGPQWDALGKAGDKVFLVEAKAHVGEFLSPPSKASDASLRKIDAAFERVRTDIGAWNSTRWSEVLFQYANRIAHLWFLRENGVDARLVFVSFINDREMDGPASEAVWAAAFDVADHALGLSPGHKLKPFIHHVHPDVRLI